MTVMSNEEEISKLPIDIPLEERNLVENELVSEDTVSNPATWLNQISIYSADSIPVIPNDGTMSASTTPDSCIDWDSGENVFELEYLAALVKESYNSSNRFKEEDELHKWNEIELYKTMVETVQNHIKYKNINCDEDILLQYLKDVFQMDDTAHEEILQELSNEPIKQRLTVNILKASTILSKKKDGFTDPFCVLYLESSPNDWYTTKEKSDTLDPVWMDLCEFSIKDYENDALCAEVWYMKSKGNKKANKARCSIKKSDSNAATHYKKRGCKLVGQCRIPLMGVDRINDGEEVDETNSDDVRIYSLRKNKKNKIRGDLHMKFVSSMHDGMSMHQHVYLLQKVISYEIKALDIKCWMGQMRTAARTVIDYHVKQRNICDKNKFLSKWIAYCRIHRQNPISYTILEDLILDWFDVLANGSRSTEEDTKIFYETETIFLHSCLYIIKHIRQICLQGTLSGVIREQLKSIFKILSILNSLGGFYTTDLISENPINLILNESQNDQGYKIGVREAVELAVMQGGKLLFDGLQKFNKLQDLGEEDLTCLCDEVFKTREIDVLFQKEFKMPYNTILYAYLANRITAFCKRSVSEYHDSRLEFEYTKEYNPLSEKFRMLYIQMETFKNVGYIYYPDKLNSLEICTFYKWFENGFTYYFKSLCETLLQEIGPLVETETFLVFDDNIRTKSVDNLLQKCLQIKKNWIELHWSDSTFSFEMMMNINQRLLECCKHYSNQMIRRVNRYNKGFIDPECVDKHQIYISKASYSVVNNLFYLIRSARNCENGFIFKVKDVGGKLMKTLSRKQKKNYVKMRDILMNQTLNELQSQLNDLLKNMATLMEPAIKKFAKRINENNIFVFNVLKEYLEANFEILKSKLYRENYETVYAEVVTFISTELRSSIMKEKVISLNDPLLNQLINDLNASDSACLINKYIQSRYLEQTKVEEKYGRPRYGIVSMKVVVSNNTLKIDIMNCYKLNPLHYIVPIRKMFNANKTTQEIENKCKPFVKIKFIPQEHFLQIGKIQTKVSRTVNPKFSDEFNIPLTSEQMNLDNAMIHVEVWEEKKIKNKFLADAFLPISKLLQNLDPRPDAKNLTCEHLKRTPPTSNDIYRMLKRKKNDEMVIKFISKLERRLNDCKDEQ